MAASNLKQVANQGDLDRDSQFLENIQVLHVKIMNELKTLFRIMLCLATRKKYCKWLDINIKKPSMLMMIIAKQDNID